MNTGLTFTCGHPGEERTYPVATTPRISVCKAPEGGWTAFIAFAYQGDAPGLTWVRYTSRPMPLRRLARACAEELLVQFLGSMPAKVQCAWTVGGPR